MSSIERLSIQGIRSFGANSEDVQTIRFTTPITLILGENGCGKTTIIECLKYALTGECPPGSDRGKNFVHDPKIHNAYDTLGQIKLEVRNLQGQRLSVCRSMKVYMKRGRSTFETLDSTINYLTSHTDAPSSSRASSSNASISTRCANVDEIMSRFMGVSKAIINNVLLCHQEDSSWPLDEPKKLKEKFDAIFGITEYNKAIDRINKMHKEEMDQLKMHESNLKFASYVKREMEEKTCKLQLHKDKAKEIDEQCVQCDADLQPINEKLKKIFDIEKEYGKHLSRKVELQTRQTNCQDQIANLKSKIQTIYQGSLDELNDEIINYKNRMALKFEKENDLDKRINTLHQEQNALLQKNGKIEKKLIIVTQNLKTLKENKMEFGKLLEDILSKLKMSKDNMPNVLTAPANILSKQLDDICKAMVQEQQQIGESNQQYDRDDQKYQNDIDKLRVDLAKVHEAIKLLLKQKSTCELELKQNARKLLDSEAANSELLAVTEQIKKAEIDNAAKEDQIEQLHLKETIDNEKQIIKKLDEEFNQVDQRLAELNAISKVLAQIELMQNDLEKRQQDIRRLKFKHSDSLKRILVDKLPLQLNCKQRILAINEELKIQNKELSDKMAKSKYQQQKLQMQRKSLLDDIKKSKKLLEESEEIIYEKCRSTPYEELLNKSKLLISNYQLELGSQKSAEALYKKYVQQIIEEEHKPSCPLCHKDMTKQEANKLSSDLEEEIQHLPQNILKTQRHLKEEEKNYEKLLNLKPIIDRVHRLKIDIPHLEKELEQLMIEIATVDNDIESYVLLLAEPTEKIDLINSIMGDISLLDEAFRNEENLKANIEKLKTQLPVNNTENNTNIEELTKKKRNITKQLENSRKQLDKALHTYEENMNLLTKLRDLHNELQRKQIALQKNSQQYPQLKQRKLELSETIVKISEDIEKKQNQITPLNKELNKVINDKAADKKRKRALLLDMQTRFDHLKQCQHDLQKLYKEISSLDSLNLDEQLNNLNTDLQSCQDAMKEKEKILNDYSKQLDILKTERISQQNIERNLNDNRDLKMLQLNMEKISKEYETIRDQLDNYNYDNVLRQKQKLNDERDEITKRKGELCGQRGEINHTIKQLSKELDEPKYRDAFYNYKRCYYEMVICRKSSTDLTQCRLAMEWAIRRFHSDKMKEINRLVREYWRLIYRGNDIDYIQIRTEDDADTAAGKQSNERRRNYTYRVEQSKNDTIIEMRGRCSAGQRVLASLIIRMALAETFSTNCGVLALDEPTTNLDRSNIESLCNALNRIVEERQTQSNFMLIIITHDDAFLSFMGRIASYNRVSRNSDCKSIISVKKV